MKDTIVQTPIDHNLVRRKIEESKLKNVGKASIREIKALINSIEKDCNTKFIRMEMGVPGLPASRIGVNAQTKALQSGIASVYPDIEGLPELKNEISRFINLFLDIDVNPKNCIPCTGSTNGSFISFLTAARMYEDKDTTLFLDPGFPVHKMQLKVIGLNQTNLDVYDYRGDRLRAKLEEILSNGNISTILYSNPNNPSWICFSEKELKIIGELSQKYGVVVLEDLAYFNMDFRKSYSNPGMPPFQPTVGRYCEDYILLISSSKIFSYAGERIGALAISNHLFDTNSPHLLKYYSSENFGHALVYGGAYAVSAGVTHSTQYALYALLKATNDGEHRFIDEVKVYGERAKIAKKIFLDNGFKIVYDMDDGEPIADGFYFTVSYDGFSGDELIEELLYYGVSAISLSTTGSTRKEGIRACVSFISNEQMPELQNRLKIFHENHKG